MKGGVNYERSDLEMMSSGKIDWPKLIADGERLGITVVQEESKLSGPKFERVRIWIHALRVRSDIMFLNA